MAKFLLRLDDEIYERLIKRATEKKRSINKHIEHIIECDLDSVEIPIEGTVNKDGTIKIRKYWNSPDGIE